MTTMPITGGDFSCFLTQLQAEPAVLVRVTASQGSVPREVGAWMAVFAHSIVGTIGGGRLEWDAMQTARQWLVPPGFVAGAGSGTDAPTGERPYTQRVPLGPSLGQCCGGVVYLSYERVTAHDVPALQQRWQAQRLVVALFGGGHVGRALVQALAPLPFQVRWFDSRDEVFPPGLPSQVQTDHSDPIQAAVMDVPAGSRVLIMSFSHAEDLEIVDACLRRRATQHDLPFVGLIGSATKWATFRRRLALRGWSPEALEGITCPIGLPGIRGKQPEVIAASVAAQLLMLDGSAGPCEGG